MNSVEKHIIHFKKTIGNALEQLNILGVNLTLFVIDDQERMIGTLTDGDIRRALLKGVRLEDTVDAVMHSQFRYLQKDNISIDYVKQLKRSGIKVVPMLSNDLRILKVIDLEKKRSVLPLDAVIMAGGEGKRLQPLTNDMPKPMLAISGKPILEHMLNRLDKFGIENIFITVRYLAEKIEDYFGRGQSKGIHITYIREQDRMGTIGALSLIRDFHHDTVLVTNADLMTNIDLEDFYREFIGKQADMAVATVPYRVQVPYATLELDKDTILSFKEKPTYTYYSNAGIYLIRKSLLQYIPENKFFDATDFLELLMQKKHKIISYPILGYWQDIGKLEDFYKAQEDVRHLKDMSDD